MMIGPNQLKDSTSVLASGLANGSALTQHVKQKDNSVFYRANNFRVNMHHSKEVGLIFNDTKIAANVSQLAQNTLDININGNAHKVMFERENDALLINCKACFKRPCFIFRFL